MWCVLALLVPPAVALLWWFMIPFWGKTWTL